MKQALELAPGRDKGASPTDFTVYVFGDRNDETWSVLRRTFKNEAHLVFDIDAGKLEHSIVIMDSHQIKSSNWAVVMFDPKFDNSMLNLVSRSVARDLPVIVGSSRKLPDKIWHWKSDAQAKGYIFEVATSHEDFRFRVGPTLKAITSRWRQNHPKQTESFREPTDKILGTKAARPEEDLLALPGISHATQLLRSPSGRLDAERIRQMFGLKRAGLAALIGSSPEALRQTPDSQNIQSQLLHFERMAALLAVVKTPDIFRKWLNSPNGELEDRPPLAFIFEKRWEVVENLVADILENRGR
jgi:hypothetical protein